MQIPLCQKRNGMYLFCGRDFDRVAELALEAYAPQALREPQPLDIEALADEGYSLTILDRCLSAAGSVLGLISFADMEVLLADEDRQPRRELLRSGTILVDSRLRAPGQRARRRFTIAHETAHWMIHRQMFLGENAAYGLRREHRFIACREAGQTREGGVWTEEDRMEWQADRMAAALLMPARSFFPAADEAMQRCHAGRFLLENCGMRETSAVVQELSERFDVSHSAVRLRLRQEGYLRSPNIA